MKKIVLLTSRYPYGNKETFIDPEIWFVKNIARLDIIPTNEDINKMSLRLIPNEVNVIKLIKKKTLYVKIWYIITALLQKSTWKELNYQRKRKQLNFKNIYSELGFILRGNFLFKKLEKYYIDDLINHKKDIVFYSFWMLETAYAAAKLRQKYGVHAVTRAHRVDLYEFHQSMGNQILPMRKYIIDNLDYVYSISDNGKKYMSENFDYGEKIKVSYLGTKDYGIRKVEDSNRIFIIASCARMVSVKRIDLLVQALEEIKNVTIKWIHFGDGPEREKIQNEIKKLPNNIEAILKGDVDHDEVLNYYKNNDIHLFVNTSTSEGVPVSIMEAISFGIPTIATNVGGTNEVIMDGVNGICVSKEITPNELSKLIINFAELKKEDYMDLRNNTRSFWKKRFDANANYTTFYKGLLMGDELND